jgi:hypothetical protein
MIGSTIIGIAENGAAFCPPAPISFVIPVKGGPRV